MSKCRACREHSEDECLCDAVGEVGELLAIGQGVRASVWRGSAKNWNRDVIRMEWERVWNS